MSRLILHRAVGSPPARSVMMLSEILGLKMEYNDVKILQNEQKSPEFKKLNPMGTVPVLQDGDFVLSESHAIMKYMVSKYGGDKSESLYPSDLRTRAVVDQCLFFNAGVFFKALGNAAMSAFTGFEKPTAQHIADIESSFSVVDAYLQSRPYIAADRLTLADLAAGATATSIQVFRKVDADKFPRCADWLSRLGEEQVFKTVMAPGAEYFHKLMHAIWEKNKKKSQK
nr:GSTD1x [Helicoverpa armigera]